MAIERQVISLSLSPTNPNAQRVLAALEQEQIPSRERSATLLAWLVAYLDGNGRMQAGQSNEMSDEELDAILEDF